MKIFSTCFFAVCLSACSDSTPLGGTYYVNRNDSSHVYIWKKTKEKSLVVVDEQVVDWKRVNDYLVVLRKIAHSPDCYDEKGVATIITHFSDEDEFWIFNLKSGLEYGPYNAKNYKLKLSEIGLPFVGLQAHKNYYTNTDYFNKIVRNCKKLSLKVGGAGLIVGNGLYFSRTAAAESLKNGEPRSGRSHV